MDWSTFLQFISNPFVAALNIPFSVASNWIAGQVPDYVTAAIQNGANTLTGWLGTAYITIITGVINAFPLGGVFPTSFHAAAQYFGNALASVNFVVPVGALMTCITLVLSGTAI